MKKDSIPISPNSLSIIQNKKWSNLLDDYENYVKEYISHYKKALEGNTVSATIYPYLKVKSEDLAKKIYKAHHKSLLTKEQINRIKKIHSKIATTCC